MSVTMPMSSTSRSAHLAARAQRRSTGAAPRLARQGSERIARTRRRSPPDGRAGPRYCGCTACSAGGQRRGHAPASVAGRTSGRSAGRISQPAAPAWRARRRRSSRPCPGGPTSSRCQGSPLARTASSVRSSTGLPASSGLQLVPRAAGGAKALAAAGGQHDHGGQGRISGAVMRRSITRCRKVAVRRQSRHDLPQRHHWPPCARATSAPSWTKPSSAADPLRPVRALARPRPSTPRCPNPTR